MRTVQVTLRGTFGILLATMAIGASSGYAAGECLGQPVTVNLGACPAGEACRRNFADDPAQNVVQAGSGRWIIKVGADDRLCGGPSPQELWATIGPDGVLPSYAHRARIAAHPRASTTVVRARIATQARGGHGVTWFVKDQKYGDFRVTFTGGDGDDIFHLGLADGLRDVIDGGAGEYDTLTFDGDAVDPADVFTHIESVEPLGEKD